MSKIPRLIAGVGAAIFVGLIVSAADGDAPRSQKSDRATQTSDSASKHAADDLASSNFFAGPIQRFEITLSKSAMSTLAGVHGWGGTKTDVPATVKVGDNTYEKVALHLKGAAGSFRPIFSNPALTLNFGKLQDGQKFEGMRKIHLNNSVQDNSRMSELFCGELYRRAGVPATRATHALVTLNGRDLGLYVLKEGFDKPFLRRNFKDPSGNLYDGGFVQDVDNDLQRDNGEGEDTHADLRALAAAAMERDPATRLKKFERVLDVDRFVTLVAMQCLMDDWDGYVRNRNNYRIYHDPVTDKMVFLPHGMDQMFESPNSPLIRPFGGLVARQFDSIPGMRSRLLQRIGEITNTIFTADAVNEIIDPPHKRMVAAISGQRNQSAWIERSVQDFKGRVFQRLARVTTGVPKPLAFDSNGELALGKRSWVEHQEQGVGADLSRVNEGGHAMLVIRASQPGSVGSFRTTVLLPAGTYRFEARAKAKEIQAAQSIRGAGAGVRISGDGRANHLLNTTDWWVLTHDFEVEDQTEVQLVVELRANAGEVMFDPATFKLRRL